MKKLVPVGFLFIMLAACSDMIQSRPAEIPTSTSLPTRTAAETLMPTMTPLPPGETPDEVSRLPTEGQTASEWNGLPIMPGAITGEGDEEGYVFTIRATPQQVQEYYQLELGKLGWQLLSREEGDSSVMLIFINSASETITVNVIAKEEEVLVLLVK